MRFAYLLLFTLCFGVITAQDGLRFISNDQPKENRSQLGLSKKPIEVSDSLIINFSFSLYSKLFIGDILSIKNTSDKSIISLDYNFTYSSDNKSFLQLNLKGEKNLIEVQIPDEFIQFEKWMKVQLKLDYKLNNIALTFLEQTTIVDNVFNTENNFIQLIFGKNELNYNIPAFNLKEVEVLTKNQNIYFPLNEKEGSIANSTNNRIKGQITNPLWLVDNRREWKLIKQIEFDSNHNILYDPEGLHFLILGEKEFHQLNVISYINDKKAYSIPSKFHSYKSGKAFISPISKDIIMYQTGEPNIETNEFLKKKLGIYDSYDDLKTIMKNSYSIGSMNPSTLEWKPLFKNSILKKPLFNHNTHYDYKSNSFILFGGYSDFKYKNEFLKLNIKDSRIQKLVFKGDTIYPRHKSGMGLMKNNSLLIYAGEGNFTGDEIIGKKPYNDLYEIDLNTNAIKRLWKNKTITNYGSVSENLILNEKEDFFYSLAYNWKNESIGLKKVSVNDGNEILLGNQIEFDTSILANDFNLFYESKNNRLYAYTKEFKDNRLKENTIRFYSIQMEPIPYKVEESVIFLSEDNNNIDFKWIALFALLLALFIIAYINTKRKFSKSKKQTNKDYIFIRSDRSDLKLFFNNIIALEAIKDYTKVIVLDNSYMAHGNLSSFIKKFPENKFIRIHRSSVINIDFVTSLDGNTITLGKYHYTIGGKYRSSIKKLLI